MVSGLYIRIDCNKRLATIRRVLNQNIPQAGWGEAAYDEAAGRSRAGPMKCRWVDSPTIQPTLVPYWTFRASKRTVVINFFEGRLNEILCKLANQKFEHITGG